MSGRLWRRAPVCWLPVTRHKPGKLLGCGAVLALLAGCATPPPPPSDAHLIATTTPPVAEAARHIPDIAAPVPALPRPQPSAAMETYSVVVSQVSVQTLLFAMARDARLNLDIHPAITGTVTLNAIDQTIHEILDRIARQVDMRWEIEGRNLFVVPDAPFLRTYRVDYPNIRREFSSAMTNQPESGGGTASALSTATINSAADNPFWTVLIENLRDLLRETDRVLPTEAGVGASATPPAAPAAPPTGAGASGATPVAVPQAPRSQFREAASVIANPAAGVVSVRATARQHQRVREFIDQVMRSSRRQVLIEATIVEVGLTQDYQQGINWSIVRQGVNGNTDLSLSQAPGGGGAVSTGGNPTFLGALSFLRRGTQFDLSATIRLLESFGRTRVLSSPKISVINNQPALLKVADNRVYFQISAQTQQGTGGSASVTTFTTEQRTVPVGFLMNVIPQIGDDDTITLNLRPTTTRIIGYVVDPNPDLARAGITSRVPEIQTREFESVLRVRDGEVAVLGGLMQDDLSRMNDEIPGAGRVPLLGDLFRHRADRVNKSELVIFLRPTILRDNSLQGDLAFIRDRLPAVQTTEPRRP